MFVRHFDLKRLGKKTHRSKENIDAQEPCETIKEKWWLPVSAQASGRCASCIVSIRHVFLIIVTALCPVYKLGCLKQVYELTDADVCVFSVLLSPLLATDTEMCLFFRFYFKLSMEWAELYIYEVIFIIRPSVLGVPLLNQINSISSRDT